jgi:hypothetical protein
MIPNCDKPCHDSQFSPIIQSFCLSRFSICYAVDDSRKTRATSTVDFFFKSRIACLIRDMEWGDGLDNERKLLDFCSRMHECQLQKEEKQISMTGRITSFGNALHRISSRCMRNRFRLLHHLHLPVFEPQSYQFDKMDSFLKLRQMQEPK